jgi:hypothetical protein
MTTALDEARHRLDENWRRLTAALESETGLRIGRRGWAVLALAFCGGVALIGGRWGSRGPNPPEAS